MRGILYRAYPQGWQVWKAVDGENDYRMIAEFDEEPSASQITDAFARDSFEQRKAREESGTYAEGANVPVGLLAGPVALAVAAAAYYFYTMGNLHL